MDAVKVAVQRLRHLSNEFIEVRKIPACERKEVASKIADRANELLMCCWRMGCLRSIKSLCNAFASFQDQEDTSGIHLDDIWFEMHLLYKLVGYGEATFEEIESICTYTSANGESIDQETKDRFFYLAGGLLAKDGLMDTPPIFIGPHMTETEIEAAKIEHSFEVLGYYAKGCEVLASIIEREMASKREDKDAGGSACVDGLHADNRMLVWGGVSFPLTTNQSIVFRLLVDAYQAGGGDVFINDIEDELGGGQLRDSFRRNHNGAKVYDPSWELIIKGKRKDSKRMIDPSVVRADPKKFSDPQRNPQRSPE